MALTLLALVTGILASVAASRTQWALAFSLWIANRFLDGLDGTQARVHGRQSDFGGYLDILLDFVVYAAIPIGIATGANTIAVWLATAVLLGGYFVNAASWMYLSAMLEQRGAGARTRNELTSVTMPRGLVAGTETVVFFSLFLLFPAWYTTLAWTMTGGVAIGIVQRVVWAARHLR